MPKVIGIISQHPDIAHECSEIRRVFDDMEEKLKFLVKQQEQIQQKAYDRKMQIWDRILELLHEKRMLPENYKPETHIMDFSINSDSIYWHSPEELAQKQSPMQAFLMPWPPGGSGPT